MRPAGDRLSSLLAFDFTSFDYRDAIRGSVVTAVVASIALIQGDPKAAIPLSIGAVFAAVSEAGQPFGARWRTMLTTTMALMVAAFLGSMLSEAVWLAIVVTAPVAFICGLAGSLGKRAGVTGLLALVVFSIYVGIPVPMADATSTAALIFTGGVVQTVATIAMGMIRGQHREAVAKSPTVSVREGIRNPIFIAHASRLMVVMTIATAISENFDIPHPYWLPMSVAWMSKPDHDGTVDRVTHRLTGTVIGLLLTAAIALAFPLSEGGFLVLSLVGAAVAIAFIWVNYAIAVAGVTTWVIALFGMVGDPVVQTVGIRLLATFAAAILVLLAALTLTGRNPQKRKQSQD